MQRFLLILLIIAPFLNSVLASTAQDVNPTLLPDVNRAYSKTIKGDFFGQSLEFTGSNVDLWHFADPAASAIEGMNANKAYATYKISDEAKDVIVAVIDSGVDVRHKDLQGKLWVNKDEIWNNGVDDDGNGYIDDIFGWNFIGNAKGMATITDTDSDVDNGFSYQLGDSAKQVVGDTLEITRELVRLRAIAQSGKISEEEKKYLNELEENYKNDNDGSGYYDLESNTRLIVGDNYSDLSERYYGNNDVIADLGHAFHGTHVSGIIAANRLNDDASMGVASKVRIMAIRVVPDGDERDKDVANGIRYAVDNGAKIINMSFGKAYKLNKEVVDKAVAYAESKGVILVHAAGNSTHNNDVMPNFPNRKNTVSIEEGAEFSNWLEVGASGKLKEKLPAYFSNFGPKSVDFFAPGVEIISTIPNDKYAPASGTSMASPVVAGTLAALLNFVPTATPMEAKAALINSVRIYPGLEVVHGGIKREFATLSITGGVIDLYNAIKKLKKE